MSRAVGKYSRGARQPAPPLTIRQWRELLNLVREAWATVRACPIGPENEPRLTSRLAEAMRELLDGGHPAEYLVAYVADDAKTVNPETQTYEQRPDLHIVLTRAQGGTQGAPLLAEAKVLNKAKSHQRLAGYCEDGIQRFVDREYALQRLDGLMLGYVRDDSTLEGHLKPELHRRKATGADPLQTTDITPTPESDVLLSTHQREITFMDQHGRFEVGPITLTHLWLDARPVEPTLLGAE